jgi:hypothetical protein
MRSWSASACDAGARGYGCEQTDAQSDAYERMNRHCQ